LAKDPDDDPVIQTAAVGKADVLCTLDRHFHQPDVRGWITNQGIQVTSDVELLHMLRHEEERTAPEE
jgi:predicted nucleic acid-binding protein